MKTTSLQAVSARYRCTIARAAGEILCAAGLAPRRYPVAIRRQAIPETLVRQARDYLARVQARGNYIPAGPMGDLP